MIYFQKKHEFELDLSLFLNFIERNLLKSGHILVDVLMKKEYEITNLTDRQKLKLFIKHHAVKCTYSFLLSLSLSDFVFWMSFYKVYCFQILLICQYKLIYLHFNSISSSVINIALYLTYMY